jgi:hypothetical protein
VLRAVPAVLRRQIREHWPTLLHRLPSENQRLQLRVAETHRQITSGDPMNSNGQTFAAAV